MADNVVRRDVIEISWDIDDSPLKKLTKQTQEFQSSVKKSVGGSESKINDFAKSVNNTQKELKKLKLSSKLESDIALADAALAKVKKTVMKVQGEFTRLKMQASLAVGAIQALSKQNLSRLKTWVNNVYTSIKNIVPVARNFVVSLKDMAKSKIKNTVADLKRAKDILTEGNTGAKGLATALKNVGKITLAKIIKGITSIKNGVTGAINGVKNFGTAIKTGFSKGVYAGKSFLKTLKSIDREQLKKVTSAVDKLTKKIGSGLVSASKKGLNAIKNFALAGGAAIASITALSVNGYADYEQLVGGVETLFGAGGQSIEEYAKSVGKSVDAVKGDYGKLMEAQSLVMKNANDAYKTAGLSANEYMETVTGFAASLKQSLGGDTVAAAKKADLALTDMADNSNKMGTDMESIQYAYQGFAKQNYTMLDNLKLG